MTSKEALNEIKSMFEGIDAAECFDYDITNQEYYDGIEKDLDKVEIYENFTIPNLKSLIVKLYNKQGLSADELEAVNNILEVCRPAKKINSKIALNKLIHCCLAKEERDVESQFSADELKSIVEKDLDLLESIKEVFKKVIYAPYNTVDFDNTIVPIPKAKIAEDFDKELFRQVLEQCGFEIKEK